MRMTLDQEVQRSQKNEGQAITAHDDSHLLRLEARLSAQIIL